MVKIHDHIMPRITMTREEFMRETPPGSIALDGFVGIPPKVYSNGGRPDAEIIQGAGPWFDEATWRANFNHHEGVVREATMSTARQVKFALKGGLIKYAPCDIHIWRNDPDDDATSAAFLILNHELVEETKTIPALNRLIEIVDCLDVTAGAYPIDLRAELLQEHAWVFEPYTRARKSGQLQTADEGTMLSISEAIYGRIHKLIRSEAGRVKLDTQYKILHASKHGYDVVDEIGGTDARRFLYSHGHDALVSLVSSQDGHYRYSIGKRSQFIPFPVKGILAFLNTKEPGWGGSDIIGGSPRNGDSRFAPAELANMIDEFLDSRTK